tara:strand:+ start:1943 stop:3163 length:1221 start_codon:yes stop_codon:yes gene_type:complete
MAKWTRWLSGVFSNSATQQQNGGQSTTPPSSGVIKPKSVTVDSALQVSAVYACVKLLTETVSSLPLKVYNTVDGSLVEDTTSRLATILGSTPNAIDTPVEFKETLLLNLNTNGNAYGQIRRGAGDQLIAIEPLASAQMEVSMIDGVVEYRYTGSDGIPRVLPTDDIIHFRFMGNGIVGLNPIEYAAGSISNQLASEDFASRYFQSGAKPSGVMSTDMVLTDAQHAQVMGRFANMSDGTSNAHRTLVLEAGMKYQQVQLSPEAMQLLENKRYNLEDIARFYAIPSVLINDTTAGTTWGSGIEQIKLGWLSTGLSPLLTRIEQRLERSLTTAGSGVRIKFDTTQFMRADSKGQAEFLSKLVTNGIMTRNEARSRLNLSAMDNADELTAQVNLAPLVDLGSDTESGNEA